MQLVRVQEEKGEAEECKNSRPFFHAWGTLTHFDFITVEPRGSHGLLECQINNMAAVFKEPQGE